MKSSSPFGRTLVSFALVAAPVSVASAQANPPANAPAPEAAEGLDDEVPEGAETPLSRHEAEGVAYRSIGVSFRESFAPAGVIELFVGDAPRGIRVPQVAVEYSRRIDAFEVTASLVYADYQFHGAFRNDNDTRFEYEWLDSSLRSVGVGAGVSWGSHFSDVFSIEGGLDFGLGALIGHVNRTEAYPSLGGNPVSGGGFGRCTSPVSPGSPGGDSPAGSDFDPSRFGDPANGVTSYCGAPLNGGLTDPDVKDGEQYGVRYRTWLHGGKMPFLSFRIAPRLSFRFKLAPRFVLRIDTGFDVGSGAFVGAAMHYVFGGVTNGRP